MPSAMKHHFLLPLLLLLLPLPLLCHATSLPVAVHDVDGRNLRSGNKYYVLPIIRGRGGGLTLAPRGNDTCPLFVAQSDIEVDRGLPVTFSPYNASAGRDAIVRESTDLNVEFAAVTICVQTLVWRLGELDEATGRRYVAASGAKGSPGLGTVSNWFKIERYGVRDYKLSFCPSVCSFCKVVCGDVGVFSEGGKRWLGLTDAPFPVMFKRAAP